VLGSLIGSPTFSVLCLVALSRAFAATTRVCVQERAWMARRPRRHQRSCAAHRGLRVVGPNRGRSAWIAVSACQPPISHEAFRCSHSVSILAVAAVADVAAAVTVVVVGSFLDLQTRLPLCCFVVIAVAASPAVSLSFFSPP